jgi:hypothetical protein
MIPWRCRADGAAQRSRWHGTALAFGSIAPLLFFRFFSFHAACDRSLDSGQVPPRRNSKLLL